MSDLSRHSNEVWDLFFELVHPCDEALSQSEVEASLKSAGIDLDAAVLQMNRLIDAHNAKSRISSAQRTRTTIAEKVRHIVAPPLSDLRAGIQTLIGNATKGAEQLAYFHKLESAATEQDLQSLMDDLQKLATIRDLSSFNDTKTQ